MPRARCPERDLAFQLWLDSGKTRKLKDIAAELQVSEGQVRKWKNQDKWKSNVINQSKGNVTKRKGGQKGNKNAAGHGAPKQNHNAQKYGFYAKLIPEETLEIMKQVDLMDPMDLLWEQIQLQRAAIIRAQQIAHVKDQEDQVRAVSMESSSDTGESTAYAVQFAWDRQQNFMDAQSRSMNVLAKLIRQYTDMLQERGDIVTPEQKLRLEKLQLEVDRMKSGGNTDDDQVLQFIEGMKNDTPDT